MTPIKQFHLPIGDSRQNRILVSKTINATGIKETQLNGEIRDNRPLPASIEVKVGSTLSAEPGTSATILFEVTNNRPFLTEFFFNIHDNDNYILRAFPNKALVSPGSTVLVKVDMFAEKIRTTRPGANPDTVTLTAEWRTSTGNLESVTKHAYFYLESQQYDATKPYIWYEYAGDCTGSSTPQNCNVKTWRAEVTVQDSTSGLLSFRSDPIGLILSKEFIVGTRDQISGYYSTSCCHTKVDIIATDVLGNTISKTIDIEKKWLNTGEISAIVLGSILLLLLIIVIVVGIIACIRRNKRTLNIYPDHRIAD